MAIFRTPRPSVVSASVATADSQVLELRRIQPGVITGASRDQNGGGGGGGGGGELDDADSTAAASPTTGLRPGPRAASLALLCFLPALVGAVLVFGRDGNPTFTAAPGIGAFALFYVAAQAAERVVEILMPLSERVVEARDTGTSKSQRVAARDQAVADAVRAVADGDAGANAKATDAAKAQAKVDQGRTDRALISFGATAALGMLLCAYLGADFLTAVGVDFAGDGVPGWQTQTLMMLVTGLVVGAGSKQLHDSISNLSKSSEAKSTPAETGGKA